MIDGEGVSHEGALIDMAVDAGFIAKSGAWYSYGEERIGQGRENARQFLKENPDIASRIEEQVREHYGIAVPGEKVPGDKDGGEEK
jgi:recombination protein RecA